MAPLGAWTYGSDERQHRERRDHPRVKPRRPGGGLRSPGARGGAGAPAGGSPRAAPVPLRSAADAARELCGLPPPVYPGPYAAPKTNALSLVSLISALVGLFIVPVIGSIVAVVTGHISLHQLKTSGETGRGMALAGVIIGWISVGLMVIGIVILIWFLAVLAASGAASYRDYYSS